MNKVIAFGFDFGFESETRSEERRTRRILGPGLKCGEREEVRERGPKLQRVWRRERLTYQT